MIKTFRGKMASGDLEQIRLKTIDGATGYKVSKFQAIGADIFGTSSSELILKIYTKAQTSATADIDFSDSALLGVATYSSHENGHLYPEDQTVIFDNTVFNQDIYVTALCKQGNAGNFYIELEIVKLRDNENEYIALRDIKATLPQHG